MIERQVSNNILKAFGIDLQKGTWSVELLNQHPGSKWITISGSHVLIKNGRVIAGNPHTMKFVNDQLEVKEGSKEINIGSRFGDTEHLGLELVRYSDKAILIKGNTYANLDKLKSLKEKVGAGTYNKTLGGWVFPFSHKDTVLGELSSDMRKDPSSSVEDDKKIQNVIDLKNSFDEGTKVIVDGQPGTINDKDVDENGLNYHIKTDDGKIINNVDEKKIEVPAETDPKKIEDEINKANPVTRNKVTKQIFGKPEEKEPTEKEEKSNEDKSKLIRESSYTTPTGINLDKLPDYTGVNHLDIALSDVKTILDKPKPYYIVPIDERKFAMNSYSLSFIKIDDDKYLISTDLFNQPSYSLPQDEREAIIKSQKFALVTSDVLLATQEYFRDKAKAKQDVEHAEYVEKLKKIYEDDGKFKVPKKRLKILGGNRITMSYFKMFKELKDKSSAIPGKYYDPKAASSIEFNEIRKILDYKKNDMDIQKEDNDNTYHKGEDTSYGDAGTKDTLLETHGVKIKKQNGAEISTTETNQIKESLDQVYKTFGDRSSMAKNFGLKISHAGTKMQHARKAVGIYFPAYKAIGVSDYSGEGQFGFTMAHEWAHFMDNHVGNKNYRHYASDDYNSVAGKIANVFRDNMNEKSESSYYNRTCECFARALEQYHAFKTDGVDAKKQAKNKYVDDPNYIKHKTFSEKVEPLIEQFLKDNDHLLKGAMDSLNIIKL